MPYLLKRLVPSIKEYISVHFIHNGLFKPLILVDYCKTPSNVFIVFDNYQYGRQNKE